MPTRRSFIILSVIFTLSHATANPIQHIIENFQAEPAEFLFNSFIVLFLLVAGGILAGKLYEGNNSKMLITIGLTIGLMTLDEVNLELLAKCGSPQDKEYASKIIPIRKDGYFLLVSLLLANTVQSKYDCKII